MCPPEQIVIEKLKCYVGWVSVGVWGAERVCAESSVSFLSCPWSICQDTANIEHELNSGFYLITASNMNRLRYQIYMSGCTSIVVLYCFTMLFILLVLIWLLK